MLQWAPLGGGGGRDCCSQVEISFRCLRGLPLQGRDGIWIASGMRRTWQTPGSVIPASGRMVHGILLLALVFPVVALVFCSLELRHFGTSAER